MRRVVAAILVALAALFVLQYVRTGRPHSTPETIDPRLISLAPNLTELLFELGVGNQLVGVTRYCTYPPEAQKKEKIGDFVNPNIEKIVDLKPDLVLAERWTSAKIVSQLRRLEIDVLETLSARSITEIYEVIRSVGRAVGKAERAQQLTHTMRERVRAVEQRGKRFPHRPTLYVEIDLPSWTVGRNSFINEAIHLCGARNLFEDIERPALQISKEMVLQRNPEIILSFEARASDIGQRPGWDQLQAVRSGRIIDDFNRDLFARGNHRLVEGMEELQGRIAEFVNE